ncbi:SanA/YdcF family protein [Mycolicibacterium sp. XJ1904]
MRRWLAVGVLVAFALVELLITVSGTWVFVRSRERIFSVGDAPLTSVGIVFGAAVDGSEPGAYLRGRLDAAVELFADGRVEMIIVSGDALPPDDQEVTVMRNYLQDKGIPPERLMDDPRGFDTDDTCRNARLNFDVRRALLVTQDFHASRAVALCRAWQIDAFGVIAAECECSWPSLARNYARETLLSRPAAFVSAIRADLAGQQ